MKSIRFASKLAYIGNTGSGSVQGYWTIWEVSGHGQPRPVKTNQNPDDLRKYRGTLYDYDAYCDGQFVVVSLQTCPTCGRERMDGQSGQCLDCVRYQ